LARFDCFVALDRLFWHARDSLEKASVKISRKQNYFIRKLFRMILKVNKIILYEKYFGTILKLNKKDSKTETIFERF